MKKRKNMSAVVFDNNARSRNMIQKTLMRLDIGYLFLDDEVKAKNAIKKNFWGQLNHKIFIVNGSTLSEESFYIIISLRNKYSEKITIFVILEEENDNLSQKFYKYGASKVCTIDVFQSHFFNWYMRLNNGDIYINNANDSEYDFSGQTVLLVEDNYLNSELTIEFLQTVNLNVLVSYDGQSAVEKYKNCCSNIKLILMDIEMPLLNGYEATRAIRSMNKENSKSVPILALTANSLPEDMESIKESGMNGCITKPIVTSNLYETIAKYLKNNAYKSQQKD